MQKGAEPLRSQFGILDESGQGSPFEINDIADDSQIPELHIIDEDDYVSEIEFIFYFDCEELPYCAVAKNENSEKKKNSFENFIQNIVVVGD